jgi:hypothetical protein
MSPCLARQPVSFMLHRSRYAAPCLSVSIPVTTTVLAICNCATGCLLPSAWGKSSGKRAGGRGVQKGLTGPTGDGTFFNEWLSMQRPGSRQTLLSHCWAKHWRAARSLGRRCIQSTRAETPGRWTRGIETGHVGLIMISSN